MARPHLAGLVEDGWNRALGSVLRARGWRHRIVAHVGYGGPDSLRVLARVLMAPEGEGTPPSGDDRLEAELRRRGWRNFLTAEAVGAEVTITIDVAADGTGGAATDPPSGAVSGDAGAPAAGRLVVHRSRADRSGNLDVRLPNPGLPPGRHQVIVQTDHSEPTQAPVLVVDAHEEFGIVSDIDDTVIRTYLPRPLIAAYNAFVVTEGARTPVSGMADLYAELLAGHPTAPTVYVSTGAWNTAPTLTRFLDRHGYPSGPLLLTDWGPTNTGWFRSGQQHKQQCLEDLATHFPRIRWVLVGDDGQHDPAIYAEFAQRHPDNVRAILIRQLAAGEQVLAHGTPSSRSGQDRAAPASAAPEVRAPDGDGLRQRLPDLA